jgi:hypothetical protein
VAEGIVAAAVPLCCRYSRFWTNWKLKPKATKRPVSISFAAPLKLLFVKSPAMLAWKVL